MAPGNQPDSGHMVGEGGEHNLALLSGLVPGGVKYPRERGVSGPLRASHTQQGSPRVSVTTVDSGHRLS